MKSITTALSVLLIFQIFGIVQVGYLPILIGYGLNLIIGLVLTFFVEAVKEGYRRAEK